MGNINNELRRVKAKLALLNSKELPLQAVLCDFVDNSTMGINNVQGYVTQEIRELKQQYLKEIKQIQPKDSKQQEINFKK